MNKEKMKKLQIKQWCGSVPLSNSWRKEMDDVSCHRSSSCLRNQTKWQWESQSTDIC